MSYNLWRLFFEDDIDAFRQFLARATFERNASRATSAATTATLKVGSPGSLSTSPRTPLKSRKSGQPQSTPGRTTGPVLTRADINARDAHGRTLLHHLVSSSSENALDFVKTLLGVPFLDLYVQDAENGWTALHRALYFGNVAAAQLLMAKDYQNATDYTTHTSHINAGGLVKIKDHEGNSPFEVLEMTIAPRSLREPAMTLNAVDEDAQSLNSFDVDDDFHASRANDKYSRRAPGDLDGDEVFAFGSNKNITLGLGDGDDRHFPERVQLERPVHLLQRLLNDYQTSRGGDISTDLSDSSAGIAGIDGIPAVVRFQHIVVREVVMSKLHSAILTTDPISNLYICGFGPGGRLGTGDESTRFSFTCLQAGGLSSRKVASIALGQDHTVAVCTSGEVFTWGSNKYGQLGYELPDMATKEVPMQLSPRQIYGLIKKEQILGASASSIHSVLYTATGLYSFGKNDGQLGLMDADARSLEMQTIPRRVGVSVLQSAIVAVACIDRATTVLLENHDVIVFTHYGWTKITFPLEPFGSKYAMEAFFVRHRLDTKHICNITAGGNTICAMSTHGEVFTIDVPQRVEAVPSNKSTTNPAKARNALPQPQKIWSIRKSHMAATDAAVGQDGSIILCTASGTVWKKEKRANIKSVMPASAKTVKPKDYKFVRVPNIFNAIGVRSNAHGAFTAVRQNSKVMTEQITIHPSRLWLDTFQLLAFKDYGTSSDDSNMLSSPSNPAAIRKALLANEEAEMDFHDITLNHSPLSDFGFDAWITSNVSDVKLPVHIYMLKARSRVLRKALTTFQEAYYFSIPNVMDIKYDADGQVSVEFGGADFLTIVNFVLYIYSDTVADFWRWTAKALHLAPRYRQIRNELMRIATALEMKQLERGVRVMDEPTRSLQDDFESAFLDTDFYSDADVVVDLADGEERYAHSTALCARCPFFDGLFNGRTGGMWAAARKSAKDDNYEPTRVDLTHCDATTFEYVLRHIYADTSDGLFDDMHNDSLDNFIDAVIDVMAIANELMLSRLAQVCQAVIGRYVTPKNVCNLLNTISESSVDDFKQAAMEYICLNLENMLDQRHLEEMDEDLFAELSEVVQSNQMAFMPIARSDHALAMLVEQDADLLSKIYVSRQRRLEYMRSQVRYTADDERPLLKARTNSFDKRRSSGVHLSPRLTPKESPKPSPALTPVDTDDELPFEIEDEVDSPSSGPNHRNRGQPAKASSSEPLTAISVQRESRSGAAQHIDSNPSSLATTPGLGIISGTVDTFGESPSVARTPWTTPQAKVERMDFKDIMEQTTSSKVSNLTRSLKEAQAQKLTVPFKMSQKERKRQQQEAKAQSQQSAAVEGGAPAKRPVSAATSPWQKVAAPPKHNLGLSRAETTILPTPLKQNAPKPAMTMRQTVAGSPAQSTAPTPPQPTRSTSIAGITQPTSTQLQVQSIRHAPLPTRLSAVDSRTSLADILSQQASEKSAIKESAAKRSLQEIQQEQEFQEWWDQESRRVQEEEAATAASGAAGHRSGKGGRGRGRGKKGVGTGRGGGAATGGQTQTSGRIGAGDNPNPEKQPSRRGENRSRGRGSTRGRGQGQAVPGPSPSA